MRDYRRNSKVRPHLKGRKTEDRRGTMDMGIEVVLVEEEDLGAAVSEEAVSGAEGDVGEQNRVCVCCCL